MPVTHSLGPPGLCRALPAVESGRCRWRRAQGAGAPKAQKGAEPGQGGDRSSEEHVGCEEAFLWESRGVREALDP